MNILIVGGTGLLGGHAALYLQSLGHQVTIAARRPAPAATPMAQLPFVSIDFVAGNTRKEDLQGFDAMVFAAGNDIRHVPPEANAPAHWLHANGEALPRFFELAREAGIPEGYNFVCAVLAGHPAPVDPYSNPDRQPKGAVNYCD